MRSPICQTSLVHVPVYHMTVTLVFSRLFPFLHLFNSLALPLCLSHIRLFFFLYPLSPPIHSKTQSTTRGSEHPATSQVLDAMEKPSQGVNWIRWPPFYQYTWKSLSHLLLHSSSSWGCFCQEFPMERGLWVPGEEAASHAPRDWLPGHQQQGQCHHDWPQWCGATLGG